MKCTWTNQEIEMLKLEFPFSETKNLLHLFPTKTFSAIKAKAKVLRLKKNKPRYIFSADQIERLKAIYADTRTDEIATEFGFPSYTIFNKAYELGLKKSEKFKENMWKANSKNLLEYGKAYRYTKGNVSYNKGKKQTEFMTPETIAKTINTRFKKGQDVWNQKLIGYERVDDDGYIRVKIAEPNKFAFKHRAVWEAEHGPIQKGYNVQFRNGIRTDCRLDNLYLISRREQLLTENGIAAIPEEIKPTYYTLQKLKKQINQHEQTNKS